MVHQNQPGRYTNTHTHHARVHNARCTQTRKTTHGLDAQHQHVDRTPCGRVN